MSPHIIPSYLLLSYLFPPQLQLLSNLDNPKSATASLTAGSAESEPVSLKISGLRKRWGREDRSVEGLLIEGCALRFEVLSLEL